MARGEPVNSDEAVAQVVRALNSIGMPYMLTGSLASNMYGVSRSTKDADFVLQTPEFDFSRFRAALGPSLRIDPRLSIETVTTTNRYIIHKLEGEPYKIELFFLSNDPHDQQRFERRKPGRLFDEPVWVASPEDVVITKLRWSKQGMRSKDIDDAKNVIAVQNDLLDWAYIHHWCNQHGTRELLEQIRMGLPPRV
jgi:hypothetical protein